VVEESVHAAASREGESGGFALGLGCFPEQVGLQLISKREGVFSRDRLVIGPHRNGSTGNTQGIGKSLLGPICGNGIALVDIHVTGLSGC